MVPLNKDQRLYWVYEMSSADLNQQITPSLDTPAARQTTASLERISRCSLSRENPYRTVRGPT